MTKFKYETEIQVEELRPRINNVEVVKQLADKLKTTPTSVVNFLVNVGAEVMNRGVDEIKTEYTRRLKDFLK